MIRTFFGSPGVGKTTLACKMAMKNRKLYDHTFCNFENSVPGCGTAEMAGLGTWTFPVGSYIAVDEAGIEYNSRSYKTLPKPTIAWFKKHRHYRCDIDVFSQSWDDMDVTIRRLSNELWYMYRLGPWTLCRRVFKRVTVDKNTQQIIDGYKMSSVLWLLIWPFQKWFPFGKKWTLTFRPFYYRYFDSWDIDTFIPTKDFPIKRPMKHKKRSAAELDSAPTDERKKNKYFVAFNSFIKSKWKKVCSSVLLLYFKIVERFGK